MEHIEQITKKPCDITLKAALWSFLVYKTKVTFTKTVCVVEL